MHKDELMGSESSLLPLGFRAAGAHAGIKNSGELDIAMIVSDGLANAAGTFTVNRFAAAPVQLCRKHLEGGVARAIVVNSGVANAGTGNAGYEDAVDTAQHASRILEIDADQVLVCSTGSIGPRLPMNLLRAGIDSLTQACSPFSGDDFARAIMTTDTRPKSWTVELQIEGKPVRVTGLAKGAGMIEPNMATMLAFIMTDAAVERETLEDLLATVVKETFNRITVDGDMSTNDTVLMLANGFAGNNHLNQDHPDWMKFKKAVNEVASRLAWMIIADGEGADKVVTIDVIGAKSDDDAERVVRAVGNSLLIKTAWAGSNPACGRIIDAVGYSGAEFNPVQVCVKYDDVVAVSGGVFNTAVASQLSKIVDRPAFRIVIDLGRGESCKSLYTCNITEEYVRINMV